jgi:hypothetical protein
MDVGPYFTACFLSQSDGLDTPFVSAAGAWFIVGETRIQQARRASNKYELLVASVLATRELQRNLL